MKSWVTDKTRNIGPGVRPSPVLGPDPSPGPGPSPSPGPSLGPGASFKKFKKSDLRISEHDGVRSLIFEVKSVEFCLQQYSRMANERENLNHLRSSVPYKKQTPIIDSGFSSKNLFENSSLE